MADLAMGGVGGANAAKKRRSGLLALAERRAFLASFLAGAVSALALPPLYLLPGLLGFALWLHLLDRAPHRRGAFLQGWFFGLGHFIIGLYWIAIAFFTDAEKFGALAIPAVLLLCAVMAVFPAIAALIFSKVRCRHPLSKALLLALAWTVAEWLRAQFLWGFPWNLMGYVWIGVLPAAQFAAYVGVYGLGLITVLAAGLWLTSFTATGSARWIGPGLSTLIIATLCITGVFRLQGGHVDLQPDLRIRLVQAHIDQHHKWDPERRADSFRRHLALSALPPKPSEPPPTHIIWPETASAYVLDDDPIARDLIAGMTPKGGYLLTGFNRFDLESEPRRAWNSLAVINHRGDIEAIYDKHRLVPFGEFLPWRGLLSRIGLKKITSGSIDFQPGDGPKTLDIQGTPPFSPLICYEAIFTTEVASKTDRPTWLLNITNDAWFGKSSGPYQHLAMARMRAIEEGLPLVRNANTGISAVVDPYGRITAKLGLGDIGTLDSSLPKPLNSPTIYARWPEISILSLVAIMIILIFLIEKVLKNRYVKFN